MYRSRCFLIFSVTFILSVAGLAQNNSVPDDTTLAHAYFTKAEKLSEQAYYDSANVYFEKASAIYEQCAVMTDNRNLWGQYINCLNKIGDNLRRIGEYEKAEEYLYKALEIGLNKLSKKHPRVADSYHNIGVVYKNKGDYDKAIEYYSKSLAARLETQGEKHLKVANNYDGIGVVYRIKGDYNKALEYIYKSLVIKLETQGEMHPDVARSYNNIAGVYWNKGDYDKALENVNKSLVIKLEILGEKHPDVASSYNNIGVVYKNKGDYDKALEYFNKSLEIGLEILGEMHPDVANNYNNIGAVYENKGDYDKALEYFNKSLAIRIETQGEMHPDLANSYYNIGVVYKNKGDYDKALEYFNKSLAIRLETQGEKHPDVANNYNNIGVIYYKKGDYDKAIGYFNKSLAIRIETLGEKHPSVAANYYDIGAFFFKQNSFEKALLYCQMSLSSLIPEWADSNIYVNPPLKNISSETAMFNSLELKADAFRRLFELIPNNSRNLYMALSTYQLAIELIGNIRRGYKTEGSKLLLGEKTSIIYNKAIHIALRAYEITGDDKYKKDAFFFAEKSKSAILFESVNELKAKRFAVIPDSLLELEKDLKIDLTFYDTQLQKERVKKNNQDSVKVRFYEDRFFSLNRKYEQLNKKLETEYPAYYDLKYQTKTISPPELQQNLAENEVLLQYFIGDSALHIFVVSNNKFDVNSQPIDSTFTELIDTLHIAIKTAQKAAYFKSAHQLYNILISPVVGQIKGKENLVIIPHGTLYKIPFEALLTKMPKKDFWQFWGGDPNSYHKLNYLGKQYNISYHYSATLYAYILRDGEKGPATSSDQLLALAPVFQKGSEESKVLLESRSDSYWEPMKSLFAGIFRDGENLNELPFSEGEVKGIANQFEQMNKIAHQLLFAEASEANFKNRVNAYNYVHLATHSFAIEEKPALSGIAFSQLNDSTDNEDDILYSGEAFNLKLNADLLVLSSCESGYGALVRGEGMMALTRGFLYAGAKNIIYSLWNVYDQHTSHMMVAFYQQMLSGDNYSQALRAAKLNMIKDAETATPALWSGFLLLGR
jgi:CHAT domain-containing protein/Tfp pilus assembly protein PilF